MTAHVTGSKQESPAEQPRTAAAPKQDINPLQRLIRQRLAERSWSYGDVARRGGLPRSTVYTLATTRNLAVLPRPNPPGCTTTTRPRPAGRTRLTGKENS